MKFLVKVMRYKHKEAMGQENAEDREAMRTACVCGNARGYRHLATNELIDLRNALNKLIDERSGVDPRKRQHSQQRSGQ